MRKIFIAIAIGASALFVGACSGGNSGAVTTTTTYSWIPSGAVQVQPGVYAIDGMLYGKDCALLDSLVKEGDAYGPTGSWENGTAKPGYGTVCFK